MNMFKPTNAGNVEEYLSLIDEPRRSEILGLHKFILAIAPKNKPELVYSMIGYGSFHYKTKSGREGDWPIVALASQKNYISVYVCAVDTNGKYVAENYKDKLPKASIGRSCIRFKKIEDINLDVLKEIILKSYQLTPAL